MKIHSYLKPVLIILILILSITGCTSNGSNSNTFDITVRIVDVMDKGIPQATVKIKKDNGDTVVAKTDENGQFSKTGLKGEVEITVAKEEYNFDNPTRTVSSSIYLKFKGKLEVKVSDKAQVLDDDIENKIVEVNENEIIFEGSNSMISNLAVGDILISDPIDNIAPNGIFRKIEGKTANGSQIILTTSQATLKDVIEQGGFSQVKELKYEDVETQSLNQTNKKIQLQASPSSAHEFRVNITKEIEIADGVKISGFLDFNLNLKLEGTFKYCILQGIRFEEIITQESGLNITYGKGIKIEKEKEIYEKTLPRVKFTIGPVPVWITPQFNLVVGVDGEVSTELTTEVTAVKEITAGFEYDTDEGFQKIFEQTNDYRREEQILEGSSNIHGYFGPKMEFDFYEVTGPTTGLYPYLDFIGEVTTDLSYLDMGWDLKGGLQGQIGAQIEFMGIDAEASYNLDLLPRMIAEGVMLKTDTLGKGTVQKEPDQLLYYVPVWKGEDAEIKITAQPDTGYRFDHWETGYNNIGSENPYNIKIDKPTLVTAVFEETPPKNHTLTIDTSGEGTVTPPEGSHEYNEGAEVTLEANPADGWEFVEWTGDVSSTNPITTVTMNEDKNITVVFEEENNPPIIDISSSTDNLTATISGPITDSDGTVEEVTIDWGDGNTTTISSGFDSINESHIYASSGSYTVKVSATDSKGATASESLTVNVSETNNTPIIDVSSSTNNLTATISGSISDSDGNVSSAEIDWGDGNTTTISNAFDSIDENHTYNSEGTYDVIITATDDDGKTANTSLKVPVEEKFPLFNITIINYPSVVDIGVEMNIEVEVTNNGDEFGEAFIDLFIDSTGSFVDDKEVSLVPGESEIVELSYITEEDDGSEIEVIVKPFNKTTNEYDSIDKVWVDLEVLNQKPYFEVDIIDYPLEPVYYEEEITVRGEVKNTGGAGSQDILFSFGKYHAEAKENIELDPGERIEISFNHEPIEDDIGYNTISLASVDSEIIDQDILEDKIEVIGLLFTDLEPENDPIYVTEPDYHAKLYCSGSNFENVQAIVYEWKGAVSGSSDWIKGDNDWNLAVTIESDTSMILEPIVIENEPSWAGTLYYTVTLMDDRGQTASQSFEVTYEP